ncbi:membrane protein [Clostridia bacterium]|nr:membrane protein [Clostridia bacterium]
MLIQLLGAYLSGLSYSIAFNVPKKYLFYTGLTALLGSWMYLLSKMFSLPYPILFGGMVIAAVSNIFARLLKTPVTLFLIPGVLPLVPGVSIYRWIASFIAGDVNSSTYHLMNTLQTAGGIALAFFLVDSVFRTRQWPGQKKEKADTD